MCSSDLTTHNPAAHDRPNDEAEERDDVVDERDARDSRESKANEQDVASHVAGEDVIESEITVGVNHARRRCEQEQTRGVPVVNR